MVNNAGMISQGMYSEIKYDGERVQLHKKGSQFQFYSRSLKPVLPHKVADLTESVPKAFPSGQDMILDCEVLLVDNTTGLFKTAVLKFIMSSQISLYVPT